ncbi:hypothetical protein [Hymenobacter cheonanensis]|uniref:hypothetical protein n=1 Tax=Hymenobacter sp. CA2-7 TaxID=3063993 RepID=UPI00271425B6|nr:hypothetical protein [Hymenobacter sp. CA2-7]MDO7886913.1 hypothetical protein [Hymenobacter sp. CA2-7]
MMAGLNLIGMNKKPTVAPAGQAELFGSPSQTALIPALSAPVAEANGLVLEELSAQLLHSYPRYGLAVAAYLAQLPETVTEAALRTALVRAIEAGLGKFRMRTWNNSLHDKVLRFESIKLGELADKPQLVQSAGLAAQGIYLFPTLVTTDGGAKDTFRNAQEISKLLQGSTPLSATFTLSRSFAPTTAKINNGTASQSPPPGTLLEAACAVITTVTHLKPAAWPGVNTVIIPDLSLPQLREFIAVFEEMLGQETADLMCTKERPLAVMAAPKATGKAAKPAASEFRRPRLHSGNYPDAPRDAGAFGPVGLLGAIGRWARRTKQHGWGRAVLATLAGQPLHVISYEQINQVRFDHHTTRLALDHDLTSIVDSLYLGTQFYSEAGKPGTPFGKPEFKTFCLIAGRFLQSFTTAAFIDFMAFRAEYAAEIEPLFTEYFRTMKPEIVASAGELGRWLNRTAYFEAKAEAEDFPSKKKGKDQQMKEGKAKILVVLESAALSAKSPEAMISQVLTQAGRMSLDEAPDEARRFIDAANTGEITHEQAKHLLISYMRLRSVGKSKAVVDEVKAAGSTDSEPQATEDYDHSIDN